MNRFIKSTAVALTALLAVATMTTQKASAGDYQHGYHGGGEYNPTPSRQYNPNNNNNPSRHEVSGCVRFRNADGSVANNGIKDWGCGGAGSADAEGPTCG